MKKTNFIVTALFAAVTVIMLTSCSTFSIEDASSTPNSVVELEGAGYFDGPTFGYMNTNGELIELTDCGQYSFWVKYCKSEDATHSFKWTTSRRGSISNASFTVEGEKYDMECKDTWSSTTICLPKK